MCVCVIIYLSIYLPTYLSIYLSRLSERPKHPRLHDLYALDCAMLCRLQEFFPLVGFCIAVPSFSSVDEPGWAARWAQRKHIKTPKISRVSWISFRRNLALFLTSIFWGPRCWHSFMAVSLSSSSACLPQLCSVCQVCVRLEHVRTVSVWAFWARAFWSFCPSHGLIPSGPACRTPSSSRRRPSSKGVGAADFALVTESHMLYIETLVRSLCRENAGCYRCLGSLLKFLALLLQFLELLYSYKSAT